MQNTPFLGDLEKYGEATADHVSVIDSARQDEVLSARLSGSQDPKRHTNKTLIVYGWYSAMKSSSSALSELKLVS